MSTRGTILATRTSDGVRAAEDRTRLVIVQLANARLAFQQGDLAAARGALRALRTTDFFGGAAASESYFAVIRDRRSTDDEIEEAIVHLLRLRPAGIGSDGHS